MIHIYIGLVHLMFIFSHHNFLQILYKQNIQFKCNIQIIRFWNNSNSNLLYIVYYVITFNKIFMGTKPIIMNDFQTNIIKQGFLFKQSRYLKRWRKRWVVLSPDSIYTFEMEKIYKSATEIIDLRKIILIKSIHNQSKMETIFVIERLSQAINTKQRQFYFESTNHKERSQWIRQISRLMLLFIMPQNTQSTMFQKW